MLGLLIASVIAPLLPAGPPASRALADVAPRPGAGVAPSIVRPATLNGTLAMQLAASLPFGPNPTQLLYDAANGLVYVIGSDNFPHGGVLGTVGIFRNASLVANLSVGYSPTTEALDTDSGWVYVANSMSYNLSVINQTSLVGAAYIGVEPEVVSYDPSDHLLYAVSHSIGFGDEVDVVQGLNVTAHFSIGGNVTNAVYDPRNGETYVGSDPGAVVVLKGNGTLARIVTGGNPGEIAYDARTGLVYVPTRDQNVTVINGTTIIANLTVGPTPEAGTSGAIYDDVNGYVYVFDTGSGSVGVLNGTTLLGSVPIGAGPADGAVDTSTGNLVVCDRNQNTVVVVAGTSVAAVVPVGEEPWTAVYDPLDHQTDVSVTLANTVDVLRWNRVYEVTFNETGLPAGTLWTAQVGLRANSSTTAADSVAVTNGTYPFYVLLLPGYDPTPTTGNVTVAGANQTFNVTFAWTGPAPMYPIALHPVGLPSGTPWSVVVNSSTITASTATDLHLMRSDGAYTYSARSSDIAYAAPDGTFQVAGSSVTVDVVFSAVRFTVTFDADPALPSGTEWSVTLNGTTETRAGPIPFPDVPNGTYNYSVTAPPNWSDNLPNGSVSVAGSAVNVSVSLIPIIPPTLVTTGTESTINTELLVVGAVVLVAGLAGAAVLWRRRQRARPPPE